jgi:IS1 family transposase
MMNLFYCLKALRGNAPACFDGRRRYEEFRDVPTTVPTTNVSVVRTFRSA